MPVTNKTKLSHANTSKSLRTTVPANIIQHLNLKDGDVIEWILKPNGKEFAVSLEFHKGAIYQ